METELLEEKIKLLPSSSKQGTTMVKQDNPEIKLTKYAPKEKEELIASLSEEAKNIALILTGATSEYKKLDDFDNL